MLSSMKILVFSILSCIFLRSANAELITCVQNKCSDVKLDLNKEFNFKCDGVDFLPITVGAFCTKAVVKSEHDCHSSGEMKTVVGPKSDGHGHALEWVGTTPSDNKDYQTTGVHVKYVNKVKETITYWGSCGDGDNAENVVKITLSSGGILYALTNKFITIIITTIIAAMSL